MKELIVAGRDSRLSLIQIQEVLSELRGFDPDIGFKVIGIKTGGDRDLTTSLRGMEKTDFFTRELDEMLFEGKCRAAVHSAKDLPDPIREGLCAAAITRGIDPSDSLVLRDGRLHPGSVIATSSERREEAVRELCGDVSFVDIRGTIEQRLKKMNEGIVDGVVIAEAAIIRLGLTDLNRIPLPGETAPLQGKLAVLVRDGDEEMKELFSCIDSRCAHSTQG